jgi:hypothetical protein
MPAYSFVTVWTLEAPIEPVWQAIYHSEDWPRWWRGVESVTVLQPGDRQGLGAVRRFCWKSKLPYRLRFDMRVVRIEPPRLLEGHATGELEGEGVWRLEQSGSVTTVRYDWNVRTARWWMNLIAPLARPLFEWNHDVVMRQGGDGLARLLGGAGGSGVVGGLG